jgi:D-amino-acid dehydrogenase
MLTEPRPAPSGGVARRTVSVVIVGGGVIGVCSAYFLARRGAAVTVLERGEVARGASFGNAGAITPGHVPINKPGRLRQALRSLNRPTSPLYLAPRWDPALARWLWTFARHCSQAHLEASMAVLGPLGHASMSLFDQLVADEALSCAYRRDGFYEVYRTEQGLAAGREDAALIRRFGYESAVLPGAEMRDREPALADGVVGGVHYPEGATVDPYRFVVELAERAARAGASIRTGAEVRAVRVRGSRVEGVELVGGAIVAADVVVLAAGAHTVRLADPLGIRLPLQPAKGYHRDHDPRDGATPRLRTACILGEASVFCADLGGFVRFAGTLEFSGLNERMRRTRLEQLTVAAKRFLTGMGDSNPTSEWCGLRPCLPDGLPAIGPAAGNTGLFLATGHAMMGLTLGPVTGKLVAEYVLDGAPSADLRALSASRF